MRRDNKSLILIVDDNMDNLQVLGSILKKSGYNLAVAKNGVEAIESVKNKLPDLILLDIMMPVMDGFETCEKIKEIDYAKDIPIIFITALSDTKDKLKAFKAGGMDYITKPFVKEEVLARVDVNVERRNAEKALQASEKKFREIAANIPGVVYQFVLRQDGSYSFQYISAGCYQLFGLTPNEIIEKPALAFRMTCIEDFDPDNATIKDWTKLMRIWAKEFQIKSKAGHIKWVSGASSASLLPDESTCWNGVLSDITERKRIENLREDVERIVRHDLKNPLAVIMLFSEFLLNEKELMENVQEYLTQIYSSSLEMLYMLNHSLDLFMMEEGTYSLEAMQIDLVTIFKELKEGFIHFKKMRFLDIFFKLNEKELNWDESYLVSGEETHLKSLFANLIKNALEASPDNGDVIVSIQNEAHSHIIDIHNVAVIPEPIRDNFFDRYVTYGKESGTGLGTYSALLIAKAHKGDISFTTSENEGTHLIVTLPKRL